MAKGKVKFDIKNHKEVAAKIIKGWQQIGDDIFDLSQQEGYVPVDEGTLKASGTKENISKGLIIRYRTSYAAVQEFGTDRHEEAVPQHHVKRHKRKTLVHKKYVRAHERGPFRRTVGPREGKHFLGRAYETFKPRLNKVLVKYIGDVT